MTLSRAQNSEKTDRYCRLTIIIKRSLRFAKWQVLSDVALCLSVLEIVSEFRRGLKIVSEFRRVLEIASEFR